MEILTKYWYIVLIAFIGFIFLASRSGSSGNLTQIGGVEDRTGLLSIQANRDAQNQAAKVGIVQQLLSYDLALKNSVIQSDLAYASLDSAERIAEIQAEANESQSSLANSLALQLANLQYASQNNAYNQQIALQQLAYEQQNRQARNNGIYSIISSGVGSILGGIFGGGNNSSGGYRTPSIFGSWF